MKTGTAVTRGRVVNSAEITDRTSDGVSTLAMEKAAASDHKLAVAKIAKKSSA